MLETIMATLTGLFFISGSCTDSFPLLLGATRIVLDLMQPRLSLSSWILQATMQSTDCIDNFHPETVKRSQLIEWMDNAGCKQIDVQHSYVRNQIKDSAKFNYLMTDDSIPNRGKAGSVAYMEEVRHACVKWLIDNKPDVLENIPYFPEGAPIIHVWARCKSYAAQKWEGRRSVSELASHSLSTLYRQTRRSNYSTTTTTTTSSSRKTKSKNGLII